MKIKQTLLSGLLLVSASLLAGEPVLVQEPSNSEFLKSSSNLFGRKQSPRSILSIKKSSAPASARDWDMAEVTKGGFFINFGVSIQSSYYLNPGHYTGIPGYKLGYDFEFGSIFRLAKINDGQMGISLRCTWLSFNYSKFNWDKDVYRAIQIMPIHIGPQFSYALNDMMGVDAFYTIGYNFTDEFASIDDPLQKKDVGENLTYSGISHEIGAAFRFKVFSLGLGYRFGKLRWNTWVYDGHDYSDLIDSSDPKASINNFRITLGFRF